MWICIITGDVNLGHLATVMSMGFSMTKLLK